MGFQKGHKLNLGNQYAKGNKHTSDWKKSASERMKGNTQGFIKGKSSPRKGIKATKPAWNKGKKVPKLSGINHWNYIEDRTQLKKQNRRNDPSYQEWRKNVWERDGYKCKIQNKDCKGNIQAHHILRWSEYPKLRYEVNNGITLCEFHHPRKKVEENNLIPTFLTALDLDISHLNWNERMN